MIINETIIYGEKEYRIETNYPFEGKIFVNGVPCEDVKRAGKSNTYYAVLSDDRLIVTVCKKKVDLIELGEDGDPDKTIRRNNAVNLGFFEKMIIAILVVVPIAFAEILITKFGSPYTKPIIVVAILAVPNYVGINVLRRPYIEKKVKRIVMYSASFLAFVASIIAGAMFLGII